MLRRIDFFSAYMATLRGISAWMAARSVVPTRLPAPFPPLLPPLTSAMSWEVATDGLDDPNLCAALAEIDDESFRLLVGSRRIVSDETNRRLVPLRTLAGADGDPVDPPPFGPADLLQELAEEWEYELTPTRLHALRPLPASCGLGPDFQRSARRKLSRQVSSSISRRKTPNVCKGCWCRASPRCGKEADRDLHDELLRSAFAPSNRILDLAYIERPEDLGRVPVASGAPPCRCCRDRGLVHGR